MYLKGYILAALGFLSLSQLAATLDQPAIVPR